MAGSRNTNLSFLPKLSKIDLLHTSNNKQNAGRERGRNHEWDVQGLFHWKEYNVPDDTRHPTQLRGNEIQPLRRGKYGKGQVTEDEIY